MALYSGTLKIHYADEIWARVYPLFKLAVHAVDLIFTAALAAYVIAVLADFISTFVNIEFLGRAETGRLGVFLWNISMNRGDFYGLVWTVSMVYIFAVIIASLPVSPFLSGILRRRRGDHEADIFDAVRASVAGLFIIYLISEISVYAHIMPQISRTVWFVASLL